MNYSLCCGHGFIEGDRPELYGTCRHCGGKWGYTTVPLSEQEKLRAVVGKLSGYLKSIRSSCQYKLKLSKKWPDSAQGNHHFQVYINTINTALDESKELLGGK